MKFIQTLYLLSAVALSVIIVGVSCFQFSGIKSAIEIPFEEPMDEDAKDISDDFADDKEYTSHRYLSQIDFSVLNHSAGYRVSHANHVKEISTPPPKI